MQAARRQTEQRPTPVPEPAAAAAAGPRCGEARRAGGCEQPPLLHHPFISPSFISSSLHPPLPATTSGPVRTRFTLRYHGSSSSSSSGAPIGFGRLVSQVLDSLVLPPSLRRAHRTRFRWRPSSPRSARAGSESCAAAGCSGICGGTGSWF